jgi:hypothetical protein
MKKQNVQKIQTVNKKSNRVYGMIGMVALFLVGVIFGFIINGSDRINRSIMTEEQCEMLADKMESAVRGNNFDDIRTLNKIYSENCLNRVFPKLTHKVKEEKLPETTCEVIEELLKRELEPEYDMYYGAHEHNAEIYKNLAIKGCDENRDKYAKLSQRETEIANALKYKEGVGGEDMSTCEQIERVLIPELRCVDGYEICGNPDTHINNAKIYANLSERGCPENSGKYKELAKQEIDIARALTDDNVERNRRESVEIVETYKRLQMQKEAAKMIEKAKKLTNPAIDFIIELEKIIEE